MEKLLSVIMIFVVINVTNAQENLSANPLVLNDISIEEERKLLPPDDSTIFESKNEKRKNDKYIRRITLYPLQISNLDYTFRDDETYETEIEDNRKSYVFKLAPKIIDFEVEGNNTFFKINWYDSQLGSSTSASFLYKINSIWSIGVSGSYDKYSFDREIYSDDSLASTAYTEERLSIIGLMSRFLIQVDNLQHTFTFQVGKALSASSETIDDYIDDENDSIDKEEFSFIPIGIGYDVKYRNGNTLFGLGATLATGGSYDNKYNKTLSRTQLQSSIFPSITFEF